MTFGLNSALAATALGVALLAAAPAMAKDVLIGTAIYEAKPQVDVVKGPKGIGAFAALRLEVKGSDVEVLDLKVVYGNGTAEDIRVRQTFKAGTSSRNIDLKGRDRAIKDIIVTYVAKGPARIQFIGVDGGAPAATWERLGCKSVGFVVDRDVIRVGRKEGTFRAIRLKVKDAPVEFFDLRVVFGSGKSQSFRVRAVVPPGGESKPIDLEGKERGIDRVEVIYRSIPSFKGKAEVCVDGLQR